MTAGRTTFPLVAVDVGNSRVKLGYFDASQASSSFPEPANSLTLPPAWPETLLEEWLPKIAPQATWLIASVQRTTAARLTDWLHSQTNARVKLLQAADLPLIVELEHPDRVGIDRLVNAVGVNRLRDSSSAAIVIDIGSAITVDVVSASGAFLGGSILPGIGMSARALHEFTDLLPLSEMTELHDPPDPLGKSTVAALRSGLFWGAVGAMRELIARLGGSLSHPQVFLTGGAAPSVAKFLSDDTGRHAQYVPHLTLAGIALSTGS